jgi:PAS domain S-box-containing protein
MMKTFRELRVRFALVVATLFLLLLGSTAYYWMGVSDQSNLWVRHSHDVLADIQDLLLAMKSVQTSSTEFAITGDDTYIESYRACVKRVAQDEAILGSLTADNSVQQARLPALKAITAENIQNAEMTIALRREKDPSAGIVEESLVSKQRANDFEAEADKLQAEELRLWTLRTATAEREMRDVNLTLIIEALLSILMIGYGAWSAQAEVSRRARIAVALRESEERLQLVLDGFQDHAVFMLDPQGRVISWNAGAERVKGYAAKEIIGKNFSLFFPPREVAQHKPEKILRMATASGRFEESAMRVRKNGSEFPASVTTVALRDPDRNLRGFSVMSHDLTANQESEARYRGLLEAAPDGMVVTNQSGQIVLLNAKAEKQFGYPRNELLGQIVTRIIPEGFAERLIADEGRTAANALPQQISEGIELKGLRKDGSEFPIEIMLSPRESTEGILVTAAIRDVTARKQLARRFLQSQKMEAVGQLTGGIAHDFNNLLTVIIGNLSLLDRLVSGNEAALKRIKTAQKAASRGAEITRRLLVFSSNRELNPAFVLLGDSIQNMIEMASKGLGSDIKITTQLDSSVPPLFVDPAALESALLNLVVNARDAMPGGGSITIASQLQNLDDSHPSVQTGDLKAGCYVCVKVTDTGQGMSPETVEHACEPFFTTKPHTKGTGLGLAMVYGFAKQSGGIVRIYSELEHGTTVSFYLPIVEDLLHPVPKSTPKPLNTKLDGTALVVDDETDLLEVAQVYLAEMGFTVIQAKDGASALKLIAQHSEIDLIVADIAMPGGMNGAELVQKARVLRPALKIIYSSGFPADVLAERTSFLLDGPLLRKPYQRAEFTAMVQRVMEESQGESTELEISHSGA